MIIVKDINVKSIKKNFLVFFMDIIVILSSLFLARTIRSGFPNFLFEYEQLFFVLPYLILFRLFINAFFEHYKLSYMNIQVNDIFKLFIHNVVPSSILLVFRFTASIQILRVPI